MVQATTKYYLVGDFNNWTEDGTYQFYDGGPTATLSLTGAQIGKTSTEFLIKVVDDSNTWYLKNSTATTVTVDGPGVTATSYYSDYQNVNYSVSGLSTEATTTYTFTLTTTSWVSNDLNNSKLTITSSTTSSGGGNTYSKTTVNGFYLVTNLLRDDRITTLTDTYYTDNINYDRTIFKFKELQDGSYSFSLPATLNGNAQILSVKDGTYTVYGPGEKAYGIHGATTVDATGWPATDGTVPSAPADLKASSSLALNDNYWSFSTRNNGVGNDDGMYTLHFTVVDGVPSKWTITHDSHRRVAYVVNSDMSEPAQPLYDYRNNTTGGFDDKFLGSVYLEYTKTFYLLANYVINDAWISGANYYDSKSNVVDPGEASPTVDKLIRQGTGNNVWEQKDDHNLVYPGSSIDTHLTADGVYILEYNPSKGKDGGDHGLGGELWLFSGAPVFNSVSMVGTAVNGTTTTTGNTTIWDYTSLDGDMVYDEDNHCYKLVLNTTARDGATTFRFVANHSAATTWHEEDNTAANGARSPYNSSTAVGHTATLNDPNSVAYVNTDDTGITDVNILFNRPGGTWTVRFYIEATNENNDAKYKYYYTIDGTASPLYANITPPSSTINYGEYVTPAVSVTDPNYTSGETLTYVYTLDGTTPSVSSDGKTVNGTLVNYTPDDVVNSSTVGTFYMNGNNSIAEQGSSSSRIANGKTEFTLKAYAVKVNTVDGTTTYEVEGNMAAATYIFAKQGGVTPMASYTIEVVNDSIHINGDRPAINKVTATVKVTNNSTDEDDGVDVYYTSDGTDPATSDTRHIVHNRKITLYALDNGVSASNKIWVCIAGSPASLDTDGITPKANGTTHASCDYDVTYSTSEGGYLNYRHNDQSAKTYGGKGHVVLYVRPVTSTKREATYVYCYENILGANGAVTAHLLSPKQPGKIINSSTNIPTVTINGEQWYYFDLEPTEGFKEVNVQLSSPSDKNGKFHSGYVTVANINKDVFLKFNTQTGVITDVTPAYTGDYFYTTGAATGNTKGEPANPTASNPFIYVQVPTEWASGNTEVRILDSDGNAISGATYERQDAAETSANSICYKIGGLAALADGTAVKFAPYNTVTKSFGNIDNHSFTANYQNGGYYYYESQSVNGLGLIFSTGTPDAKNDKRPYGKHNVNHTAAWCEEDVCDWTHYLTKDWSYSPTPATTTRDITDNWTGSGTTVNVIPAGTTIQQTVTGLEEDTPYTVQMIVRGKSGSTGTLKLTGAEDSVATKSFTGYDAQGTITTDGRVERLLKTDKKNGWQKLEATAKASSSGTLTISLATTGEEMELSDVTLLMNANTDGYVWTTAPTNDTTTEFFLSSRAKANAFSFFDRGENKNAIIYANARTVLGMSPNTYDVVAATKDESSAAKAIRKWKNIIVYPDNPDDPDDPDAIYTYTGGNLVLTDGEPYSEDKAQGNLNWGVTREVSWKSFSYDRSFTDTSHGSGSRNTICLPFAMTEDQIKEIFGDDAKVYELTSIDVSKEEAIGDPVTETYANTPYLLEIPEDKVGVSAASTVTQEATPTDATDISTTLDNGIMIGVFTYMTQKASDDTYDYYGYDAEDNGVFKAFDPDYGATFKPFRAYLGVKKSAGAKAFYYFKVNNGSSTGIADIEVTQGLSSDAPVYNLQGQMVRRAGEQTTLPRGIYLQGGKKYIQK